ncbi:MAG: lipid-A-disaccharide synthase [Akkermansiaceae bacterium]|nr:lipid-A-disaccharide synthase [Akkermansiaceae bacterium]
MKIYVVAGEKSGDKQGALLMQEMLRHRPDIEFVGLGGNRMHEVAPAGIEDWAEQAAVIGVVEVLKHARFFMRRLREMEERIAADRPACLLLIDYPGFNQRLAERVRRRCPHTKIAWFIAPMVWAWHKGRIPKLAAILDLMLCTFPFEKPLFEAAGLRTEFVGHPLADDIIATRREGVREKHLIGLFPGSRVREIERHFPVFLKLVQQLRTLHPEWSIETSASSPKLEAMMHKMAQKAGVPLELLNIRVGNYHDLMDRAQAALVTSGTATLEAALHGLPFALVYKVAWGTYILARFILTIRFIGMVNILADKAVTRELIQHEFNVANCTAELEKLMQPETRAEVLAGMHASVDCLCQQGGAAAKAARAVLSLLG